MSSGTALTSLLGTQSASPAVSVSFATVPAAEFSARSALRVQRLRDFDQASSTPATQKLALKVSAHTCYVWLVPI